MSNRTYALIIATGLLAANGAQAQPLSVSGTLEGGYSNYDTPGANLAEWRGAGSGLFTIEKPGIAIQANFGNSGLKVRGQSADLWRYDAAVFWRDRRGAIGVDGGSDSVSAGITSTSSSTSANTGFNFVHYGMFGEFYAIPNLTLHMRGGRVDGDHAGYYSSVGLVFYPLESIAVNLTGDYIKLDKPAPTVTDVSLTAEYMPVRDVPVTLSIGYTYASLSQLSGHQDVLSAGIKWYFGGEGRSGTLVDRQRNGPENWGGPPATLVGVGF